MRIFETRRVENPTYQVHLELTQDEITRLRREVNNGQIGGNTARYISENIVLSASRVGG